MYAISVCWCRKIQTIISIKDAWRNAVLEMFTGAESCTIKDSSNLKIIAALIVRVVTVQVFLDLRRFCWVLKDFPCKDSVISVENVSALKGTQWPELAWRKLDSQQEYLLQHDLK